MSTAKFSSLKTLNINSRDEIYSSQNFSTHSKPSRLTVSVSLTILCTGFPLHTKPHRNKQVDA
jgi:hypothetical protein